MPNIAIISVLYATAVSIICLVCILSLFKLKAAHKHLRKSVRRSCSTKLVGIEMDDYYEQNSLPRMR